LSKYKYKGRASLRNVM